MIIPLEQNAKYFDHYAKWICLLKSRVAMAFKHGVSTSQHGLHWVACYVDCHPERNVTKENICQWKKRPEYLLALFLVYCSYRYSHRQPFSFPVNFKQINGKTNFINYRMLRGLWTVNHTECRQKHHVEVFQKDTGCKLVANFLCWLINREMTIKMWNMWMSAPISRFTCFLTAKHRCITAIYTESFHDRLECLYGNTPFVSFVLLSFCILYIIMLNHFVPRINCAYKSESLLLGLLS